MHIELNPIRKFLYSLTAELPCTCQQLVAEFQHQPWVADQAGYGQNNFETRYRLPKPNSELLNSIVHQVEHGEFKQQLIDTLYSDPLFAGHWGVSPEKMNTITHLYALYTWDRPGYSIRIHTDDRMHVAQGMIYFVEGDDPDQSTYFYKNFEGDEPMRVETGYGLGFVGANWNSSWHTGKNSSNKERYSLMMGLRLNL